MSSAITQGVKELVKLIPKPKAHTKERKLTKVVISQRHKLSKGGSRPSNSDSVSVMNPAGFSTSSVPSSYGFTVRNKKPKYSHGKSGAVRICHTEYVADLTSSSSGSATSAFLCSSYLLNPGNASLFPWLNFEASGFSLFRFNKLTFHLESTVSSASNGAMLMAATADCTLPTPTGKSEIMQQENAVRANVWQHCDFSVPNSILHRLPEYLVNPQAVSTSDTTREVGLLFTASQGVQASLDYGELYVSYDVEFFSSTDAVVESATFSFAPTLHSGTDKGWANLAINNSSYSIGNFATNYEPDPQWLAINGHAPEFVLIMRGTGFVALTVVSGGFYLFDQYGNSATATSSVIINSAGTGFLATFNFIPPSNPFFINSYDWVATTSGPVTAQLLPYSHYASYKSGAPHQLLQNLCVSKEKPGCDAALLREKHRDKAKANTSISSSLPFSPSNDFVSVSLPPTYLSQSSSSSSQLTSIHFR